jgi:hypothetical protein
MKPNANFNLSKSAKQMIANAPKENRNLVKKMFIQAELASSQPFRGPRVKENNKG